MSSFSCRVNDFCLQDGKVPSATLPGAGAQVASDHHLGKAGGAATQVLSLLPMSNICFKYTLRSLEYFKMNIFIAEISLMTSWSRKFSFAENIWG